MGQLYGIHRVEKHKSVGGGLEKENNRDEGMEGKFTFKNSDINWQRTHENIFLKRTNDWKGFIDREIAARLKKPPRKTAVRALEGFYGASPDWFKNKNRSEIMDYFKACLDFHQARYGTVVNAVVHFDEATPHMHVISIPFTCDGRLSAFELLGDRKKMSRTQDEFYESVCRARGLARGEIREPENARKHMDLAQYKMKQEQEKAEVAKQEAARQQARLDEVLRDINTKDNIETRVRKAVKSASKKSRFGGLLHDDNVVEMPRESYQDLRAAASCGASAMAAVRTSEEQKQAAERRADAANAGLEIARNDAAASDARMKRVEQEAAPYLQIPEVARSLAGVAIEQARQMWLEAWRVVGRCVAAAVIRGEKPWTVGAKYMSVMEKLDMPSGKYYPQKAAEAMARQVRGETPQKKSGSGWKIHPDAVDYRKPIRDSSVVASVVGANVVPVQLQSDADTYNTMLADWDMLDELTKDAIKNKRNLRDL